MSDVLAVTLNPSIDIACEANRVQPTLKVRTHGQMHDPGGGGTNVARVIASLGGAVELAYLSGGATGGLYDELLAGRGLLLKRFPMRGPVRIALMVHEQATGFEYRFVPEGPAVSADEIAPVMAHAAAFRGRYLVASGSLPPGAPDDLYAAMARHAEAAGVRFVLDTSGEALRLTLGSARVFLVKPSLGELEHLAGHKLDERGVIATATEIVAGGRVEHVAVSMGREGALLVNRDGALRLPAIHVKTLSAVGAGDSFVAALVFMLIKGEPIARAFRFGVAAGAAAALTPGTQLCRKDDVYALFNAATAAAEDAGGAAGA
jgi:6-phosphofructokinase 2